MNTTRRILLKFGVAAAGAVVVGTGISRCTPSDEIRLPNGSSAHLDAWLRIHRDGRLTVLIDRAEMGQGIETTLATLVAEELDIDLARLRTEFATGRPEYVNEMFDVQITAASSSVRLAWPALRYVGAAGRLLFVEAAARRRGVAAERCDTADGEVVLPDGLGRIPYAELAADLAVKPHGPIQLKPTTRFRLIGRALPRLDVPAKLDGSATYGIDVSLPGLLTAVIDRGPTLGAELVAFDPEPAASRRGVHQVLRVPSGIAIVADSTWHAMAARKALQARWRDTRTDSSELLVRLREAAHSGAGRRVRNDGDVEAALSRAIRRVEATYTLGLQAHAPLEPMNATADVRADGCTVWTSTQNPGGAQLVAADITGLPLDRIDVRVAYLGGSFGRRQEIDFVAEAVDLSQRLRRPVKVIWTREDDMTNDFFRPAAVCRLSAALDASGTLTGWSHAVASTSIWRRVLQTYAGLRALRWLDRSARRSAENLIGATERLLRADPNIAEGGADMPYAIEHVAVRCIDVQTTIPVGAWRSVGYAHNVFAVESFIDEIAAASTQDPLELRRRLLGRAPRLRAVLDAAAVSAGWHRRAHDDSALGVAAYVYLGTAVALVARVAPRPGGGLRIAQMHCTVDCGTVINPAIARAQIESAIVYGLGAATMHGIHVHAGAVMERNFDAYPVPRMGDVPEISIQLIESTQAPTGIGEAATPGVAPALCNAVYAATGVRVRELPFDPATISPA